jgi:hypothetical protein
MRRITSDEKCLSATEIAERFEQVSGIQLHPTNVGNAAKKLGLDYIESEFPDSPDGPGSKPQRRYAEADLRRSSSCSGNSQSSVPIAERVQRTLHGRSRPPFL